MLEITKNQKLDSDKPIKQPNSVCTQEDVWDDSLDKPNFKCGDLVFAKIMGYPHWPARIENIDDEKKDFFELFYFGTHEIGSVAATKLYCFEKFKEKFGKAKHKHFREAMWEIKNRPDAIVEDPVPSKQDIKYNGEKSEQRLAKSTAKNAKKSSERNDNYEEQIRANVSAFKTKILNDVLSESKKFAAGLTRTANALSSSKSDVAVQRLAAGSPSTSKLAKNGTPRTSIDVNDYQRRRNPPRSAKKSPDGSYEYYDAEDPEVVPFQVNMQFKKRRASDEAGGETVVPRKRRLTARRAALVEVRPPEAITQEELDAVADRVDDKKYPKKGAGGGSSCHQCRQKTKDTKTTCRSGFCVGVRGQFCGPCLQNRYGENVREALLDKEWRCPVCRDCCNCSFCMTKQGMLPTGIAIGVARSLGYTNVKDYLAGEADYGITMESDEECAMEKADDSVGENKDFTQEVKVKTENLLDDYVVDDNVVLEKNMTDNETESDADSDESVGKDSADGGVMKDYRDGIVLKNEVSVFNGDGNE